MPVLTEARHEDAGKNVVEAVNRSQIGSGFGSIFGDRDILWFAHVRESRRGSRSIRRDPRNHEKESLFCKGHPLLLGVL
jgi:hypothetical protein